MIPDAHGKRRTFKVTVFRYDSFETRPPYYSTYRVEFGRKTTVLELLKYIYKDYDSELSFRWSCGIGKCGACAVRVNGRPVISCQEIVENEDLVIEPLQNFPVIKDLVVERGLYYENRMRNGRPYLHRIGWNANSLSGIPGWKEYKSLSQCIECLACMSVCPSFTEAPHDFAGPAVFLAVAKWKAHPKDELDRASIAMYGGLHNCTCCKSCSEVCPKEIDVFREVIQPLRAANAAKGLGLPKVQAGFGDVLSKSGKLFEPRGEPFTKRNVELVGTDQSKEEVGLFLGCRFDLRLQRQAEWFVKLLVGMDYKVIIPKNQQCCGGPLQWTGQRDWMETQVRHNVRLFESFGVKTVITLCPSCGMTLKHDYSETFRRLEGREPHFQVKEASELLDSEFGLGMKDRFVSELRMRITYHDPCHLKRGLHIWEEPRRLLKSIPGVEFVELKEADQCCGGMVLSANPDLAKRLSAKKAANIIATEAEAVVTACPTCQDIIRKALVRAGCRIPVYVLQDILAMALLNEQS